LKEINAVEGPKYAPESPPILREELEELEESKEDEQENEFDRFMKRKIEGGGYILIVKP
jgi:hypothetical protein